MFRISTLLEIRCKEQIRQPCNQIACRELKPVKGNFDGKNRTCCYREARVLNIEKTE